MAAAISRSLRSAFISALVIGATLTAHAQQPVAGPNVNMVRGTKGVVGDPFLQRQNEPSIAVSTRNPCHLLAGANDYRTVDIPDSGALPGDTTTSTAAAPAGPPAKDAWLGWFKSFDCGATWRTGLLPGYPQDISAEGVNSPLKGVGAGADSTVRSGTNGMFFFSGMVFNRVDNGLSKIFVSRFIDDNNNEKDDTIRYIGAVTIDTGTKGQFADKPWIAVDIPRNGYGPAALPWVASDDGAHQSTAALADAAGTVCDIPADPVRGIPAQHFPAGNVYMAWTRFEGGGTPNPSKIMFSRSTDCGKTFKGGPISNNQKTSQGAALAIAPSDGTVYIAWREFAKNARDHAIWITRSTDGGKSFEKPRAVADLINPFDQPKSTTRFRTNTLPTIAVDHVGRVYVAWSERGFASGRPDPLTGDARIVMAVSTDGAKTFKTRYPIADRPVPGSHQVMPALRFTAGKLQIIFYDFGNDIANSPGQYVDDAGLTLRHTVDVSAATASPADKPIFQDFLITPEGTSPRISQYRTLKDPITGLLQQVQYNPANLPLYVDGSTPFLGDYIDVAGLDFVPQRQGTTDVWQPNLGSINFTGGSLQSSSSVGFPLLPVYHATWTDHRDVKPPPDGNWQNYVPPGMGGAFCDPSKAGMRNANIYTSRLTTGLYVGSPGNTKPLGFTTINGISQHIQRGFVVFLQNTTKDKIAKRYLVHIANQPGTAFGDRATFLQNPRPPYVTGTNLPAPQTWRIVAVPPLSTVARTVYVTAANVNAQVRIEVAEIVPTTPLTTLLEGSEDQLATLGPPLAAGGLRTSILLNPDASNPPITDPDFISETLPSVTTQEEHDPFIFDSLVTSIGNVKTSLLEIRTPSNPDEGNKVETPDEGNPDEGNPDEGNPDEGNPDEGNAGLLNTALGDGDLASASISDVQWKVQNKGNTISAFKFRPTFQGDRTGKRFQLFVTRRYYTPVISSDPLDYCKVVVHRSNQVVVNVADYKPRNPDEGNPDEGNPDEGNPDEGNPDEGNASFMLSPGDTATVTLRVYDTGTVVPPVEDDTKTKAAALMASYATDTTQTAPTSVVAGPDLLVLGTPHLSQTGVAPAGSLTLSWTLKNRGTSATTQTFNNRFMLRDAAGILPDRELAVSPLATPVAFDNPNTPAIEGEVALTQLLTIPRNVPPGNYLIFVVANYLEHQVEADVHNNVSTTSVPLTVAFSLSLAFATQPSLTTQDFLMTPAVRVAVLDGVNLPVGPAEVPQVTLTLGGPAAVLGGTLTQPNVNGIATFNDLHIHNVANGYFLNAMAPKSFNTTSTNFSIKVDSPPVAVAESYQTDEDVAIQTGNAGSGLPPGTEANDIDEILNGPGTAPPGRHLTAILVNGPSHAASFSLAADGNFNYVPLANYNGPDSFSYKVNDALVDSNTVAVSITVRPVNDMPTATPQSVTTAEDAPVSFTLTGADIESAPNLAFAIVTQPSHGTLSAPPSVTYTPNPNYNGPDSFTFTVTDRGDPDNCGDAVSGACTAALTSAPATVSITVTEVNDPPTGSNDALSSVAEDSGNRTISFASLLSNDSTGPANESGQTLTITAVSGAVGGTVALIGTDVIFTPTADYNGPASFTYTLQDNGTTAGSPDFKTATATAAFSITEVNDPPTGSNDALGSVAEDSGNRTISFASLLSNDSTGPANESGQALTITAVSAAVGGTVALSGTDVIFTPTADYSGPASFTYTLQDNGKTAGADDFKTATATAAFSITEVNDPPTGVNDALDSVAEDSGDRTISFASLTFNDLKGPADESGQMLTITAVSDAIGGTVALSGDNVIFTPAADFNGAASFTYTLKDNGTTAGVPDFKTATAPTTVAFTITEVNDPPVGTADDLSDVQKNSPPRAIGIATLLANDSKGPANESGQTLTIASVSDAIGGSVALGSADVVFTPAADYSGPASFVYTLQDNGTTAGVADFKTVPVMVSFTITVDTEANGVTFGVQPTDVVQGVAIDPAVTVEVRDASDAAVPDASVSMMVSPGFETTATAGGEQSGIAVDTARNRYYVANRNPDSTITVIDASTNTVIASPIVHANPSGVAVDEIRNLIFTPSSGTGFLDVIDGVSSLVVASVPVGASASQVDVDPVLGHVYVGHDTATGDVTVVNASSPYDVVGSLAGSGNVLAIRVNPANHRIYVLTSSGTLRVFDGSTLAPFDTAPIDSVSSFGAQGSIAIDPATNRIWVTDGRAGGTNFTVRVFHGTTHEVLASFLGPKGPQGIAIDAVRRRVFYGSYWDPAALVEVDADTYTVLSTTMMGGVAATALAVNPATHRIYVGHNVDNHVGVFTYPELQGGTSATTDATGVATFANLSILDVATGYRLRASTLGVLSAPSNSFNVNPPPEPLAVVIVMAAAPGPLSVTPAVQPLLITTGSFTPSQ